MIGTQNSLKLRQSVLSLPTQITNVPDNTFDLWESKNPEDSWVSTKINLNVTKPFKLIFEASGSKDSFIGLKNFELFFDPC